MAANEPIDPRVRLAISRWPDDAPRGAVSTFCAEHGISRKSFYALRKRAQADGPAAVLEPRTRRPKTSPSKLTEQVKEQAIAVRAALEGSGLDHGPISVHDKMHAIGNIGLDKVTYKIGVDHAFKQVLVIADGDQPGDKITITDLEGEILAEHTRPAPGIHYVGNGQRPGTRPKNPEPSPKP